MPKLTVLRSFQGNGSLIIATKSMRSSGRAMIFYSGIGISLLISSLSVGEAFVLSRKQSKSACNCFQLYSLSSEEESPERQLKKAVKPDILKPFLPAADPNYMNEGPVGENDFILSRNGEPKELELSNENLLRILRVECSDLEVNTLVWKCLGYRFDPHANLWNNDKCFPKWKEKYPTPPDLIGMQRIYSPEIDKPSLRANQAIVRSIPVDNKQSLKTHLKPYGFTGYQFAELTPNKTRRAQCANWLLYFREELFGFTVEELRKRRQAKKEAGEGQGDEWKPPVREVF